MRFFAITYLILALGITAVTVVFQVFPANLIIDRIVGDDGKFMIVLAFGIEFLLLILPLIVIALIYNLIVTGKKQQVLETLDGISCIIRRDKSLFGAAFPMDILIDGKRVAKIGLGGIRRIELPNTQCILQIKAFGNNSEKMELDPAKNNVTAFQVGYRLNGNKQKLYIASAE